MRRHPHDMRVGAPFMKGARVRPLTPMNESDSITCPKCGAAMEAGSVAAESLVGGAKWHKSRSTLALGGEKIGDYTTGGLVWFDGFRCSKCRILLMRY